MLDSTIDTLKHIKRVQELLNQAAIELIQRGNIHDQSKLESPEKEYFDRAKRLEHIDYGTTEYQQCLDELKPALEHHYANNSHHPQYYTNGVNGMNLFDLIEMFLDWKAASERHNTGDIYKSIEVNKDRFNLDNQIVDIFNNTVKYLN